MKLETVHELLQEWGELIITTAAGDRYEIHLGDTKFDMEQRLLILRSPHAIHVIDGDSVESVTQHYGHVKEK